MEENRQEQPESAGEPIEVFTGTISYTISLLPEGVKVEYDASLQNDLAVVTIAHLLANNAKEALKEYAKGNKDPMAKDRLNRAGQGIAWLKINFESIYQLIMRKKLSEQNKEAQVKVTTQNEVTEE